MPGGTTRLAGPEAVTFAAAPAVAGRRIAGLLIPWDTTPADGRRLTFRRGSVAEPQPWPLRVAHDSAAPAMPIGLAGVTCAVEDRADGLHLAATVPETTAGDDALELLRLGVIGGLSAEVAIRQVDEAADPPAVTAADLLAAALVPVPAFAAAAEVEVYERGGGPDLRRRRLRVAAALA
ncbi:MAG: HK97 family phage prohead protease [Gammaproteobacteria bacterium]|nr:HK97 family phage prohead protease [Gammaproteobacteria bacterium]